MNEIAVRRCNAHDAAFAAEALAAVAEGAADVDHLRRALDDPDVILSVATVRGAPAGIVYGYVYPALKTAERATLLYEVEVLPEHRRRGVGAALLRDFAAACRERGAPAHWLVTERANVAAMRLYERAGGVLSGHDDALFRFAGAEAAS